MANSADPDQLTSEAHWSGSTLYTKAGYIWVQHDILLWKLGLLGASGAGFVGF